MKIKHLFIILIISTITLCCQDNDSTNGPNTNISEPIVAQPENIDLSPLQINTFATSPDLLGALSKSVNLFTGEVDLPLNLINLPDSHGLNINVSIHYNSNVDKIVTTNNIDAPGGILGVGWSMDIPQIISDNKGTGTREDDEFYLKEGGVTTKLICTKGLKYSPPDPENPSDPSISDKMMTFKMLNYKPWVIIFSPDLEKWTIIKEDGTKYIYGDNTSGRSTVQYVVKWGNWIGDANTTGFDRQGFIWNLSQVINIWGQSIDYSYLNIENLTGVNNTEASYLSKINDSFGREIDFNYPDKSPDLYQDPHTEQEEPDAYQERYEKKHLESIEVHGRNSILMTKLTFIYTTNSFGSDPKEFLSSITTANKDGETFLPLKFNYRSDNGMLASVETPQGSSINYTYDSHKIGNSILDHTISPGYSNFAQPKVYIKDNYTVVTWRNPDDGYLDVQIYEWDGQWYLTNDEFLPVGPVSMDKQQNYNISLQNNFFAIVTGLTTYVYWKDENLLHKWNRQVINKTGELVSGNNYIGLRTSENSSFLHIYKKVIDSQSTPWAEIPITISDDNLGGNNNSNNRLIGRDNYFLLYNNSHSNDSKISMYHFSNDGTLIKTPNDISCGSNITGSPIPFYSNNFSCLLFNNKLDIYEWDDHYNFLPLNYSFTDYYSTCCVFNLENNGYGVENRNGGPGYSYSLKSLILRKNGINWVPEMVGHDLQSTYLSDDYKRWVSFDSDIMFYKYDENCQINLFDANNSTWYNLDDFSAYGNIAFGQNLFSVNEKLYYRGHDGIWSNPSGINFDANMNISYNSLKYGSNYSLFECLGSTIFIPIKNQKLLNSTLFESQRIFTISPDRSDLVGSNTFVTYSGNSDYSNITELTLHKVINDTANGQLWKIFVKGITINDGVNSYTTAYHYYEDNAVLDPSGKSVYYNQIRTIPGGKIDNDYYLSNLTRDNGYTDTYFFNNLDLGNFPRGFNRLLGKIYASSVFNNLDIMVSGIKYNWSVDTVNIKNVIGDIQDVGYLTHVLSTYNTQDNVTKKIDYSYFGGYDIDRGLLRRTDTYNSNGIGATEDISDTLIYGYEKYPGLYSLNILSPVVQQKNYVNDVCSNNSVTTLINWGTDSSPIWASNKLYICKTGNLNFDFASYSNSDPSISDWLKTQEITIRNNNGDIVESKNAVDKYSSTSFDGNGIPIAQFEDSKYSDAYAANFDDLVLDSWDNSTNWIITNNGALRYNNLDGSSPLTPKNANISQTNTIAEFEIRITDVLNNDLTNWGGFQFRKISSTDDPFTSGYTVFLRKDGGIQLYRPGTNGDLGTIQLQGDPEKWQKISIYMSGSTIRVYVNGIKAIDVVDNMYSAGKFFGFFSYQSKSEFDNLRIYPIGSSISMIGYDPLYRYATTQIGSGVNKTSNIYNSFGQKIGTVGSDNIPLATTASSLSKDRNADYNPNDPNVTLQTTILGKDGLYEDFSTNLNGWVSSPSSNTTWIIEDGKLKIANSGTTVSHLNYTLINELKGRIGIEFTVKTGTNGINFGMALGDANWQPEGLSGSAIYTVFNSANNWQTANSSNQFTNIGTWLRSNHSYRMKIVVDIDNQKAEYFIDGNPCLKSDLNTSTTASIKKLSFFTNGGNASTYSTASDVITWYVDDLMIYTDPVQTITYSDGTGKELQTQREEDNVNLIVSSKLYDNLGRNYISVVPTRVSSNKFTYLNEFVFWGSTISQNETNIAQNNIITGLAPTINNNQYCYSQKVFESSPLSRVIETSIPGSEFRIGGGHTTKYEYSTNPGYLVPFFALPPNNYFFTKVTNRDGVVNYTIKDKMGKVVGTKLGPTIYSSCGQQNINLDQTNNTKTFQPNYIQKATYTFTGGNYPNNYFYVDGPGVAICIQQTSPTTTTGTFDIEANQTYTASIGKKGIIISPDFSNLNQNINAKALITYSDFVQSQAEISVNQLTPTTSFISNTSQTIAYSCTTGYSPNNEFHIYSSDSNIDLVNVVNDGDKTNLQSSGTFDIAANKTYFVKIGPKNMVVLDGGPVASANFTINNNPNLSDPNSAIMSSSEYFNQSDLEILKTYPPNYFNPPSGSTGSSYINERHINRLGLLSYEKNSDKGETKYIYDKLGRVRFSLDNNGKNHQGGNQIKYIKYDDDGRILEEGYIAYAWIDADLQDKADNHSDWPKSPDDNPIWRKKYIYGNFDRNNTYSYNNLTEVDVNNDDDNIADISETYTYDNRCQRTGVTLNNAGFNISKDISYTYNNIGQVGTINFLPYDYTVPSQNITNNLSYEASHDISAANVTVQSGGNLTLKAGDEIKLLAGFSAVTGSNFSAKLGNSGSATTMDEVVYKYDWLGRPKSIGTNDNPAYFASYYYNQNGQMQDERLNNNSVDRTFAYNPQGWLTNISDNKSLFGEDLTYYATGYGKYNGNIYKSHITTNGTSTDYTVEYTYDDQSRLTSAKHSLTHGIDLSNYDLSAITYDANGNIHTYTEGQAFRDYRYNYGTNQVINLHGQTDEEYHHDDNGNITISTNKFLTLQYDPYFDIVNQINVTSETNGNPYKLLYGPGNERVSKINGTNQTFYIHGGSDYPLMEKQYLNGTEVGSKVYVYGPTGMIAMNDGNSWSFVLKDHLGSTRVTVNQNNQLTASFHYTPFGDNMFTSNGNNITYLFTGQENDVEFGYLQNFRARMYDSQLKRFYSVDPIEHLYSSPYVYCDNNPLNILDISGMESHTEHDENGNMSVVYDNDIIVTGYRGCNITTTEVYFGATPIFNTDGTIGKGSLYYSKSVRVINFGSNINLNPPIAPFDITSTNYGPPPDVNLEDVENEITALGVLGDITKEFILDQNSKIWFSLPQWKFYSLRFYGNQWTGYLSTVAKYDNFLKYGGYGMTAINFAIDYNKLQNSKNEYENYQTYFNMGAEAFGLVWWQVSPSYFIGNYIGNQIIKANWYLNLRNNQIIPTARNFNNFMSYGFQKGW